MKDQDILCIISQNNSDFPSESDISFETSHGSKSPVLKSPRSGVVCHVLISHVSDESGSDITNGGEGSDWKEDADGGDDQSQTGFY